MKKWLSNCFLTLISILLTISFDMSAELNETRPSDINVLLTSNVTPTFGNTSDNATICSGDSLLVFVKSSLVTDSVFIKNTLTGDTLAQGVDSVSVYIKSSLFENYQLIASDNGDTNIKNIIIKTSSPIADISGGDSVVSCYNDLKIDLNALGSSGGASFFDGSYNYSWSSIDANVSIENSTTNSIEISQLVDNRPETSQLVLEIEDSLSCKSTDTVIVVWDKFIELEIRDDLLFFCEGTSISTFAFVRGGEVLTNYQWNLITGPSDFVITADIFITVSNGQNAVIEVTAEDDFGCIFRDSLIAIEKNLELDLSVSENLVCLDDFVDLSVSFDSIPNNAYSYSWEINGQEYSTSKDTTYKVVENSNINLTVRDVAFKCDFEIKDTVNLSVPLAVAGSDLIDTIRVCEDVFFSSVDAKQSNSGTPFSGIPYEYLWSTSETNLSISQETTDNLLVENVGELNNYVGLVELQITDSLGCTGNDSVWFEWNNQFRLNVVEDTMLFCIGIPDSIDVTDNKLGTFSNHDWQLISGSATFSVKNDTTLLITEATNATFTVVAVDEFGCPSNVDTVFINDIDVNTKINVLDELSCKDDLLNLDLSFDSLNIYSFEWFINDVSYSIAKDTVFKFTSDVEIKAQVTDLVLGCVSSDSTNVFLSQPIAQAGLLDTISVCNDVFNVSIDAGLTSNGTPFTSGAPYLYSWSTSEVNLSLTQNNTDNVFVQNLGGLNNYIGLIELEVIDSIGCSSVDSVWLEWDKQKDVKLDLDTVLFCIDQLDSAKATLVGTGAFVNYEWNVISGSAVFTNRDSTVVFSSADNAIVEVVATDVDGCIFRDSLFVFDFDLNVQINSSDTIVCTNDLLPLSVSYDSLPNHVYSTKWIVNGLDYSDARDTVLTVNGSFIVKAVVTDVTLGCIAMDSINASISTPIAQAGLSDTISVCNDVFNVSIDAGLSNNGLPFTSGAPYLYSWSTSEINFSLTQNTTDNVSVQNLGGLNNFIGLIELEITDRIGCSSVDSVWLEWDKQKDVKLDLDTVLFCVDQIDSAKATLVGTGTFVNYDWNVVSGSAVFTNRDSTVVFSSADNAIVEVVATDADGCIFRDSLVVFDFDLTAEISFSDTVVCTNDLLPLNVSYDSLPNHIYSTKWIVNGLDYSESRDTVLTIDGLFTVKVIVTDETLGCIDMDSANVSISTPIAQAGLSDTISVCNDIFNTGAGSGLSTGGTPFSTGNAYLYSWTSSDINFALTQTNADSVLVENVSGSNNLVGRIELEITDRVGCTSVDSVWLEWDSQKSVKLDKDTVLFCIDQIDSAKATLVGAGTFVSYDWNIVSGVADFDINDDTTIVFRSAENAIIEVAATDASGCIFRDSLLAFDFDINTAIVFNDTVLCKEDVLNLSVTYDSLANHTYATKWVIDGADYSNSRDTILNINVATRIKAIVTDLTLGCVSEDSVEVTISSPVAVIAAREDQDSIAICSGSNQIFVSGSQSFSGTAPYQYAWSTLDTRISLSDITNDTVQVSSSLENIMTDLILTTTDNIGCTSNDTIVLDWQKGILANIDFDDLVCNSINDTIIATPNSSDLTLQWSSISGINIIGASDNDTLVYSPNNLTSDIVLNLSLENTNNCSKDTSITISTQQLSVGLQTISTEVCSNIDVPFIANQEEGSTDLFYNWDGLNQAINDSLKTYTFDSDSTIVVSVFDPNTNCFATQSISIKISELIATASVDEDSICFEDDLFIELSSVSGGAGGYDVSWSGGEFLPAVQQNNITVKPTLLGLENETSYILEVKDTLGCTVSDTVKVSRNNEIISLLPSATGSICEDSTIELGILNANASGGTGNIELSWSTSDDVISPTEGDVVTFNPTNSVSTKTVDVELSDVGFPSCVINRTITVGIEAKPVLTLGRDTTICSRDSIVLNADSTNSLGVSYEWLPTGDTTREIMVIDSLIYRVVATSDFGCVNTAEIEVKLSELKTVSLIGNDSSICTVEIKELSIEGAEFGMVTWTINKGDTTVINDTTILISSSQVLDSVLVSAHFENGCTDTIIPVLFDIKTTPVADFLFSEIDVQQFQPFDLIDNSVVGADVSYTWTVETDLGTEITTGHIGPEVVISETGTYSAQLMLIDSTTGCGDTTSKPFEILDGVNRIYIPTALYSNAVNEENRVIKVYGNNISSNDFVLEIFNRWGESVYKTTSLFDAQNIGWDGSVNSSSINSNNITAFTFALQGAFIDGSIIDQKGNITILK